MNETKIGDEWIVVEAKEIWTMTWKSDLPLA